MLFGFYRKDEVHDPQQYIAGVAAIFSGYNWRVIERVTDPRTGIAPEKTFVPSLAEIREACDRNAVLLQKMAQPVRRAMPYIPPPLKRGQIDAGEFFRRVKAGEIKPRPIGAFEPGGYLGPMSMVEDVRIAEQKITDPHQRAATVAAAEVVAYEIARGEVKLSEAARALLHNQEGRYQTARKTD
jgi:hypothetical protein